MLDDEIVKRLTQRLKGSRLRKLVTREIDSVLASYLDNISTDEYYRVAARLIVHELEDEFGTRPPLPASSIEQALLTGNLQMLRALGEAIAQRDTGNSKHNPRVTLFSTLLAETMELSAKQIQALMKGSFLHDIGKIGIGDDIILKPAGLSDEERLTMNSHPELGAAIIRGVEWFGDACDVVRYHHEWFDGTGYPTGLAGTAIPINARIFAVVDVFDALISERPYKPAYSYEKTMQMIFDRRGSHFDPWIVELFANISRRIYDELAWEPYHVLDEQLRQKVAYHFGLDSDALA